jgi:hypothetical protein
MTSSSPRNLIDQVWNYPLFEALYGRRSRRFGLGFELPDGPFRYAAAQAPVPLDELEEALLVAAGVGISGLTLWEQTPPLRQRGPDGRTFASTSGGRRTALFISNDRGVHVIDPDGGAAAHMREAETPDARAHVLALYRDHRRTLRPGRLDVPRRVPPLSAHNLWDWNRPGTTLFLPVCDVSASLISLTAQFVDGALARFVAPGERGMNIVDDRHGFRPAGTERWLADGFLDPEKVMPLSLLERQASYFMFSEPAAICQNMFLASEALGIGGWMHCGFLSREILEALGFRTVVPAGASSLANPIGLDGVFEARCPPYHRDIDAAVDAVLAPLTRADAAPRPGPTVAHRMPGDAYRQHVVTVSDDGIACTKAICRYVLETYGRFPGGIDAMHLMWCFQAHHLDIDFYDRFFQPGAYGPTHAAHMATWHPDIDQSA